MYIVMVFFPEYIFSIPWKFPAVVTKLYFFYEQFVNSPRAVFLAMKTIRGPFRSFLHFRRRRRQWP